MTRSEARARVRHLRESRGVDRCGREIRWSVERCGDDAGVYFRAVGSIQGLPDIPSSWVPRLDGGSCMFSQPALVKKLDTMENRAGRLVLARQVLGSLMKKIWGSEDAATYSESEWFPASGAGDVVAVAYAYAEVDPFPAVVRGER